MIYVFLGKDFNIVKKRIDDLVNKLNISNIIKLDFNEVGLKNILEEVNYVDLFNEKKLLIVSDFSLKKLKKDEEEMLSKYIENMDDNVIIFKCIDEALDERKSIVKLLKSKCKVEYIEKLDYKNLHEYVTNMFKENNISSTYNQVKKILDLCEYNPDYTISEVEKLLIYKYNEKELLDEDIDNVISENHEKEMFSLIENIMKKDLNGMLKSYNVLSSSNIDETIIIDQIEKQFRLLFQLKHLKGTMDEFTLSKKLEVNPYVLKKLYPYLNEYKDEQIADILYKLSEVDSDIKINGYDKKRTMELFFISL